MFRIAHAIALTVAFGVASTAQAQLLSGPKADDYPIIAQLVAAPTHYSGHIVMIYGLVVERQSPSTFMLQDVSQRPLKIVGNVNLKADVGDQLIVVGVFHDGSGGPYVAATSLIRAKVLAGGGCC